MPSHLKVLKLQIFFIRPETTKIAHWGLQHHELKRRSARSETHRTSHSPQAIQYPNICKLQVK